MINNNHKLEYSNNSNFKFGFDRRNIIIQPRIIDCMNTNNFIDREPIINNEILQPFTPIIEDDESDDDIVEEIRNVDIVEVKKIEIVEKEPLINKPLEKTFLKSINFPLSKININKKPSIKMSGNIPSSR